MQHRTRNTAARQARRAAHAETLAKRQAQAQAAAEARLAILTDHERSILRQAELIKAKLAAYDRERQVGPLHDMELTLRTSKALLAAGVTTREQLAEMSDADILKTPNLGRKALVEIRDALARTP
jgi:DNA-directed RNA polymerase alpha subunit